MQPPPSPGPAGTPPPWGPPPERSGPSSGNNVVIIVVIAAVAFLGFIGLVVVGGMAAGFFVFTRSAPPKRGPSSPTATATATTTTPSCGECSWAGTGCYAGACRLLPGQTWAVRPKAVTLRDLPTTADGQMARVCLRANGTTNCTNDFRMPKGAGGKHIIGFSHSTAAAAEIQVRTEQLSAGGFDAIVIINGTQHVSVGLAHPSGVRPGRLLFEGGLKFSGQGDTESVVVDLEAR